MSQQFIKGRTYNHLTWLMPDATDFASPESALSAAMKIKIYGKLRSASTVNFVSSGAGSMTTDIKHVGPSVLGLYTIALAKADLSDASAAWYDQYIISLSATGAAYQTIIVDGGIDLSALSALQSRVSDIQSYLVAMSGVQSDIYSALSDFQSDFGSRVPKRVATDSQLSDVLSDLRSFVGAGVALDASTMSDIRSAITAGPTGTVTASDISDIASAVWAAKYTAHSAASSFGSLFSDIYSRVVLIQSAASDAASAAAQANSRVLLNQSRISDVYSLLSDLQSDFQSRVTGVVPTGSDVASKVWAEKYTAASNVKASTFGSLVRLGASAASDAYSAALIIQSRLSDFDSRLVSDVSDIRSMLTALSDAISDAHSDLGSKIGGITASVSASDISDIASAVWANATRKLTSNISLNASDLSDLRSAITAGPAGAVTVSDISDIASAVWANAIGARVDSRVTLNLSRISDVYSLVSDLDSNFQSRVTAVLPTASDVASKVWGEKYTAASNVKASTFGSLVRLGASAASDVYSAALVIQSRLSDLDSRLVSDVSDIYSAAQQINSRVLVVQSHASDIYSLLSDLHSDVGVMSGVLSDTYSALALVASNVSDIESQIDAGVPLDASTISDLRSAITATELDASDLSDIASAVWATTRTEPTTVVSPTGTMKTGIEWLVALSRNKITQTATLQSLRNDADNSTIASATVADDATTFTRGEFAG